ncbi:MAG TPA: hypothetical protein ENH29_02050 [Bacteroidetes bacterium]|nr:hypothetical protein [Bacteroidota bacterium]
MNSKNRNRYIAISSMILLLFILWGCASQKAFWGSADSGFILNYRMEKGDILQYTISGNVNQSMEMMGQSIDTKTDFLSKYSIKINDINQQKNFLTTITIDDMSIKVNSQQGVINPDLSSIIGKKFGLTASPKGKELEYSGVDSITINMGQMAGGKQSVKNYFRDVFTDLPKKPVKIGDTWTSKDERTEPQGGMQVHMVMDAKHKLLGYEEIDGMACLKIETKGKGTLDGSGERNGAQLSFEGDLETKSTWFFAYKKGLLVKANSDSFMEATIAVSGPTDMTIPMTQETKSGLKLISPPPKK